MKVRVTYSDKDGELQTRTGECSQSDYDDAKRDKMMGRGVDAPKIYILNLILSPHSFKGIEKL